MGRKKKMTRNWREAAVLKKPKQVMILPVHISTSGLTTFSMRTYENRDSYEQL